MSSTHRPSECPDLDFRPLSYWDVTDPVTAVLVNVKGQVRRELLRGALEGGEPVASAAFEDEFRSPDLSDGARLQMGGVHPAWMGGEYLPPYLPGEVEIARLVLQSATQDVISIRARRRRNGTRIVYRVVDEYDGDIRYTWKPKSSAGPLSLRQMIGLVDSMRRDDDEQGLVKALREDQVKGGGNLEGAAWFVSVESDFYSELERHYEADAQAWLEAQEGEEAEDEEEDDAS